MLTAYLHFPPRPPGRLQYTYNNSQTTPRNAGKSKDLGSEKLPPPPAPGILAKSAPYLETEHWGEDNTLHGDLASHMKKT